MKHKHLKNMNDQALFSLVFNKEKDEVFLSTDEDALLVASYITDKLFCVEGHNAGTLINKVYLKNLFNEIFDSKITSVLATHGYYVTSEAIALTDRQSIIGSTDNVIAYRKALLLKLKEKEYKESGKIPLLDRIKTSKFIRYFY